MNADEIKEVPGPSPVQDDSQQATSPAVDAAESHREAVLESVAESLKAGTFDGEPVAETKPEAPASKGEKPQSDPAEPPAPKAAEEDPDAAYDDPDDLTPDEVDPKFTKIRERIQRQQAKLREARKELDSHRKVREATKQAGFDDQFHEKWNLLGARANLGDPAAIEELGTLITSAGFKPKVETPKPPAIDADAIYSEIFKPRVDAYKMDEDAAREAARALAAKLGSTPSAPVPAPVPQAPAPSQPQSQIPPQPQADPFEQRVVRPQCRDCIAHLRKFALKIVVINLHF